MESRETFVSLPWFGVYLLCKLAVEIFKYKLWSVRPLHFNGSLVLIENKGFKSYTDISADLLYLYIET